MGFWELLGTIGLDLLFALLVVGFVMSAAGYSVLAERKIASWMQGRVGPNRAALPLVSQIPVLGRALVGLGFWQPLADGVKFLFKEDPVPGHVNKFYYFLAPCISLIPALTIVCVVPFGVWYDAAGIAKPVVLANIDLGILFIFAVSSLGVYGIVLAGWSANSKYPFFGGIRSSAQMISYELAMGMSILPVFMWANGPAQAENGLSLFNVIQGQEGFWLFMWMPINAFVFLIALFAETNRLPFDMPESETELVGGFHTEYGSFKFGFFFLAEYAHMFVGSAIFVLLFFGGTNFLPTFGVLPEWLAQPWPHIIPLDWTPFDWAWVPTVIGSALSIAWFVFKTIFIVVFFMFIRWTVPRFRYDQVMNLGWKYLVPLALVCVVAYALIIAGIDLAAKGE